MPLSLAVPRHQADTVSATHGGDRPRACGEQQQSGDKDAVAAAPHGQESVPSPSAGAKGKYSCDLAPESVD